MGFWQSCCSEWTAKHGTVVFGVFTIVASFFWLAWEADEFIWADRMIQYGEDVCRFNPCENSGRCIMSDKPENTLGYVCDCHGTLHTGTHCNITQEDLGVPKSCGDWYKQGHRMNGTYMIDVDGHNPEDGEHFEPVNVRCEFTDTLAVTVIGFENILTTRLKKHLGDDPDDLGANHHTLDEDPDVPEEYFNLIVKFYDESAGINLYNMSMDVIDDILKDEATYQECKQSIYFKCKNYPLNLYTEGTSDIQRRSYFKVNADKIHFDGELMRLVEAPACRCYDRVTKTNNCIGKKVLYGDSDAQLARCNCDAGENAWHYDNITLTTTDSNLDRLPVHEIGFIEPQRTSSDNEEWAEWDLTPLTCYQHFKRLRTVSEEDPRELLSSKARSGIKVIWGVLLALIVITCLLILCSLILLIGVAHDACHALLPWMVMVLIFNIMVFIAIVIRAYYLGYYWVVYEIAILCMWLGITIYGMIVVAEYYSESLGTRVEHM